MAYVNQHTANGQKAVTMLVVGGLQGVAIVALISGLAVVFIPPAKVPPLVNNTFRTMPPPPPPVDDTQKAKKPIKEQKFFTPETRKTQVPQQDDSLSGGTTITGLTQGGDESGAGIDLLPMPQPTALPSFAPIRAKPLGDPSGWVSTNDYPSRDLREGNQGVTRFRLAVGANGKVAGCLVIESSGFAGLDEATCRNVSRRARFDPANDASGAAVSGSYTGTIRWLIPD